MYDARLTCVKHLVPSIGMVVIPIGDRMTATTKTLLETFKADSSFKIIINGSCFQPFKASSLEEILRHGYKNVAYFVKSLESNKSIKKKLCSAGQIATAIYSILPDLTNPRWFIPTERRLLGEAKPSIISPTSIVARAGLSLFRIFRCLGFGQVIFPYRMIVATSTKLQGSYSRNECVNELEAISQSLDFKNRPGVLYTGSYGPLQKFTLEVLDRKSQQIAYAKFGHNVHSRKAINKEHSALTSLRSISFSTMKIPDCLGIKKTEKSGDLVLLQGYLDGGRRVNGLSSVIINALAELFLATKQREKVSLQKYILKLCLNLKQVGGEGLLPEFEKIRDGLVEILTEMGQVSGNVMIPLCMSHGDFTRWNMREDKKYLYVFDWEEAGIRPPGHDLFNFIVIENLLARKQAPEKVAVQLLEETLGKNNSYCRQYFESTLGANTYNMTIYLKLFLAEIVRYNLWHVELHQKMDFPAKKSLTDILSTASIISQRIQRA